MKIISLSYQDRVLGHRINSIEFQSLNLLIGASGVGKTQILQAILNLRKIAQGESLNGIKWQLIFELEGRTYCWQGEFEFQESLIKDAQGKDCKPAVVCERLMEDGEELASRLGRETVYETKKSIIVPAQQSLIFALKEELKIGNIYYTGFWDIKEVKCINERKKLLLFTEEDKANAPININVGISNIRLLPDDTYTKLVLLSLNDPHQFSIIKQQFIILFPQVENLEIAFLSKRVSKKYEMRIKLRGVERWVAQKDMSMGMYRSLMIIAELHLCQDKSVLLMDDFESEMDVNSIDLLGEIIKESMRGIQFILTSRHPYIIHRIPYKAWLLVTRKEEGIEAKNAAEYKIYDSRQDAFRHLLQVQR